MGYDDVMGAGGRATSAATPAVDQKGAVTLSPQRPIVGEAVTATLEDSDGSVSVQAWEWESPPIGRFKLAHKVSIRFNSIKVEL